MNLEGMKKLYIFLLQKTLFVTMKSMLFLLFHPKYNFITICYKIKDFLIRTDISINSLLEGI